jgi:predicted  nucleic acid-binding Zn-ribbon protein
MGNRQSKRWRVGAAALPLACSLLIVTPPASAEGSLSDLAQQVAQARKKLDAAEKAYKQANRASRDAATIVSETRGDIASAEQELTAARKLHRSSGKRSLAASETEQETAAAAAQARSAMVQLVRATYVHGSANAELAAFVDFAAEGPAVLNALASHNAAAERIETATMTSVERTAKTATAAALTADQARNQSAAAAVRLDNAQRTLGALRDDLTTATATARKSGRGAKDAEAARDKAQAKFTRTQQQFRSALESSGGSIGDISAAPGAAAGNQAPVVWDILIGEGFSEEAAAGILGNLQQESNIDPTVLQSGGPGTGLAQWSRGGRWDTGPNSLLAFAGSRGLDPWSAVTQTRFMIYEMESVIFDFDLPRFKRSKDVIAATVYFHDVFERSADSSAFVTTVRGNYAMRWYATLAGTS